MATGEERVLPTGALAARIGEFEHKLDELKLAYEQYFLGLEKREPMQQQQDVLRLMRALDQQYISNTALRYRYQGLVARLNTYRNYWTRTLRAIEAGTYHRDVARVKRKLAREGIEMPDLGKMRSAGDIERAVRDAVEQRERKSASEIRGRSAEELRATLADDAPTPVAPRALGDARISSDIDAQLDDAFDSLVAPSAPAPAPKAERPATAASRPAATHPPRTPPATPELPPGISREQMDSLYRRFVKAKKMCGEDPSSVRYDSLVRSISRQLPKIRGDDPKKEVNFQVVIRNGRAILKAKR